MNNEVLIDAFKEEMTRSNNNSKWWNDHLSEQITKIFGSSLDASIRDAIYSSAKAFISSGSLVTSQYFYTTKELSDKKEIFATANYNEKKNIFNQINRDDKIEIINNNNNLKLKDLYEMLTVSEFNFEDKKEIANLLDDAKIKSLKENYVDLDELLKTFLGERYDQLFGKKEDKNDIKNDTPPVDLTEKESFKREEDLMSKYINSTNKIAFFNSISMNEKLELFNKLNIKDKRSLVNTSENSFLKDFYNNYRDKEGLLNLMDNNSIATLYRMSGSGDKSFISNYLSRRENRLENSIRDNIKNIRGETGNIDLFNRRINQSKDNIVNLKNQRSQIKLNIRNSVVVIKKLENRREKLEERLVKLNLKKDSRIAFLSKRKLEKMKNLLDEINMVDRSINQQQVQLNNYERKLNSIEHNITRNENNIKINQNNILKANEHIRNYSQQMYNSRVQVREVSSVHRNLVGKNAYNHSKNNMIMPVKRVKLDTILNAHNNNRSNNLTGIDKNGQSKVFQNEGKVRDDLEKLGIKFNPFENVNNEQKFNNLPVKNISSMSRKEAMMIELYFEAQYFKKMAEIAKMQQEMEMDGRSRKLKAAGFSNTFILLLLLTVLTVIGVMMFLLFK